MITMKDIAARAGVSMITVSRVVNNSGYVGKVTRRKVEAAIEELHYVPNMVASNLRSRQSDLLALLLPDITNSFWTSIARGVEDEAWEQGYGVFICNTDNNTVKEAAYVERLLRRRVEGVLMVPTPDPESEVQLARLRRQGVKFVVIHRRLLGMTADVVRSDSGEAARRLTVELARAGRKRLAFVGLPLPDPASQDRLAGFRAGLEASGLAFDEAFVRTGEAGAATGGYRMVTDLLTIENPPDGLLLANSRLAMEGLRAIGETGRHIPEDITVAAFHDISLMDPYASHLIRAVQPSYKMGQLAIRRLLELGDHDHGPYEEIILESEIHVPS
jgi:LacI family transcriptional regulator